MSDRSNRARNCKLCGEEFRTKFPSTVKAFCSVECRIRWAGMRRRHTVRSNAWRIEHLAERGYMVGEIAEILKFDRSTIVRFLKRNGAGHLTEKKRSLRLSVSKSLVAIVVEVNPTFAFDLQKEISNIVEFYNGMHQQHPALIRIVMPK